MSEAREGPLYINKIQTAKVHTSLHSLMLGPSLFVDIFYIIE